jgi:hypothetical protein
MAPSSTSERRRLAAERRARVAERNRPPSTIATSVNSIEHQRFAEKLPAEYKAQGNVVAECRAQRKPSPSPRPVPSPRPAPRPEPGENLSDSPHGERNPRAWISLTTGQTGVGAPGRNGTPYRAPYIWKTFT